MVEPRLLSDVEFFRGFEGAALDDLVAAAETRAFNRGDVVFTEDDDATELFVVESGRIAIANKSVDGRESVVALMEPGDAFGEMGLFLHERSAEARAADNSAV